MEVIGRWVHCYSITTETIRIDVVNMGAGALHSPSDVKTGTFIGDQVPQQLRVFLHTVLHVNLVLLKEQPHSQRT